MKKIVFLSRYQNYHPRGAEVFVAELSKRLEANFEVEILSGQNSDSLKNILHGGYDLVIPINGRSQSLKASVGRLFGRYKILVSGHSGIGRDDIWNIVVGKPDVFVALTDFMADWAKRWAWGSKVVKISNGVDLDKFTSTGEKLDLFLPKPIILSVGALVWYKNHIKAIDAVASLNKGSLVIVGDGPLKEELEKFGQLKLPGRFKILKLNYQDMPKIYRSADVFTLPSWDREAFGIAYLEALASNLPVVAPKDSPRQEIIGDAGVLTEVSDSKKYANSILKALTEQWGNQPREQAKKFSWDNIANQYSQLIESIL